MTYLRVIDGLAFFLKILFKYRPLRLILSTLLVLYVTQGILVHWTPLPSILAAWFAVEPDLEKADIIIVLSGGADQGRKVLEGVTLAREVYGITLWRRGYAPRILFSGGRVADNYLNDALYMKETAISLGVPEEAILVEDQSRNTLENIRLSKQLMDARGFRDALLVTSPLHMRRCLAFCQKFGLNAYPAPSPFWIHQKRGEEIFSTIKIELIGMEIYRFFDEETIRKVALFVRESGLAHLL